MSSLGRFSTALSIGVREFLRNRIFVFLIAFLPFSFITVSILVTPVTKLPVRTKVDGLAVSLVQTMPEVHGVVMTPITGAFITGLAGLFLMQSAKRVDGRLLLTDYRPTEIVLARLATLVLVAVLASGVSIAVMSMDYMPEQLAWFVLGTLLVSLTYGLIGMLLGVSLGRLAGMYVMLFAPMMDVGVFQDPMFVRGAPEWWMKLFPGYGPLQMMLDAGFTPDIDTVSHLVLSLGYLSLVGSLTVIMFVRNVRQ